MSEGIYQIEVLQHQFAQKDVEIDGLIKRLAEAGGVNEQLQGEVQLYDKKLISKSKYIEELKEKNREMKKE